MPVVTNQPSPQVINPYWQKQVVSERQEQRVDEIPEFVRENPSLLPWYRRTMESAANRGASSVTFRQVPVQREAQEQEVPDVFKQDANLSNWYGRVMESARERGASSVTFSIPKEPSKLEREPHGATYTGGIEKQYEVSDVDYEPAIVGKSPTSAGRTVMIPRKGSLPQGPTLTGWLLNQSEQAKLYERFVVVGPKPSLGLVTTAGFVASAEGVLNPQTPFVMSTQFIGGYLFGSAILGYGFSKLLQPITKPFTSLVTEKILDVYHGSTLETVTNKIGFEFKQRAPQPLLNLIYGKEMAQAVAIERAWDWSRPSVEGAEAITEMSYGMPFYRAETLGMSMPTEEWSAVRATERLAAQKSIETEWDWNSVAMGLSKGQLAETSIFTRESFETSESLNMDMPTRRIEEKWYAVTHGSPKTPMEITLKRAIESGLSTEGKGGLSASQELIFLRETAVTPSPYTFPKALTEGFGIETRPSSYVGKPQLLFQRSSFADLLGLVGLVNVMSLARVSNREEMLQIQRVNQTQSLVLNQALTQAMVQGQAVTQLQSLVQVPTQKQLQTWAVDTKVLPIKTLRFPQTFEKQFQMVPKRKKRKRGSGLYLWEFPILDPEKVLRMT